MTLYVSRTSKFTIGSACYVRVWTDDVRGAVAHIQRQGPAFDVQLRGVMVAHGRVRLLDRETVGTMREAWALGRKMVRGAAVPR
jgi:hypothetical protein